MKKVILFALALILSLSVFAQENQPFTIDSLYQKQDEYLVYSKVIDFTGKSKIEIMNGFKNWGGTTFVNLKEVIVSETEDQIVLNYITKDMYVKSLGGIFVTEWYVRLVAEFKEGKMRVSFYDDGNSFWLGNQYGPSTPARTYKLAMYFKDGEPRKMSHLGLVAFKHGVVNTANSIKLVESKKTNDNW
jgi:hypothetical protein